jgi:Low iron-inducible periplasmic protein
MSLIRSLFSLEFIQKGTVMMNIWMYVIRQMEEALDKCVAGSQTDNADAVHSWDEAVAYYVGSLQDRPGSDSGVLLYNLANYYCGYMKTCGEGSNQAIGNAAVNIRIMRAFDAAQNDLNMGQCDAARRRKVEIEKAMAIPLIQGTIIFSYLRDYDMSVDNEDDRDHVDATGAVFAASVLPLVYSCNPQDAQVIYDYMRTGIFDSDYPAVRAAFEKNYQCLGVTCADIGGIYDASKGYLLNATPCSDSGSVNVGAIVGGIIGGIIAVLLLFCVYRRYCRNRKETSHDFSAGETMREPVPPPSAFKVDGGSENIAALKDDESSLL